MPCVSSFWGLRLARNRSNFAFSHTCVLSALLIPALAKRTMAQVEREHFPEQVRDCVAHLSSSLSRELSPFCLLILFHFADTNCRAEEAHVAKN